MTLHNTRGVFRNEETETQGKGKQLRWFTYKCLKKEVKSPTSTSRLQCNMCGYRSGKWDPAAGKLPPTPLSWYRFLSNRSNAPLRPLSLGFATPPEELCAALSACAAYRCYFMRFEIMRRSCSRFVWRPLLLALVLASWDQRWHTAAGRPHVPAGFDWERL